MPVPSRRVVKEALLVGVGYATNDNLAENGFPPQPGAPKDTLNLRRLLTSKYGYQEEDITTLVDSEDVPYEQWPTRENILRAMEHLIAGKQAGDHIVFSFSGHGGQVDALVDLQEVDGKDEILLPIDCTVDPSSTDNYFLNFIRDDEIRDIFVGRLADGVHCTMIFDCCHSGTASDLPNAVSPISPTSPDSALFSPRSARAPRSFAQMQTLHDGDADAAVPYVWPSTRETYPVSRVYFEKEVTSWSACLDEQLTFGRKSGGIFMKAFTNALQSTPYPTHRQLLQSLRTQLLRITEEANRKHREAIRKMDVLARGDVLMEEEEFVPPRPQLGSLNPEKVLLTPFTL